MAQPLTIESFSQVSSIYIQASLTANVVLDTQVVEAVFLPGNQKPTASTVWATAAWTGDPGMTRSFQVMIGPGSDSHLTPEPELWTLFSRVHDDPQLVVTEHGPVRIY